MHGSGQLPGFVCMKQPLISLGRQPTVLSGCLSVIYPTRRWQVMSSRPAPRKRGFRSFKADGSRKRCQTQLAAVLDRDLRANALRAAGRVHGVAHQPGRDDACQEPVANRSLVRRPRCELDRALRVHQLDGPLARLLVVRTVDNELLHLRHRQARVGAQSLAARLITFGADMLVPLYFRRAPPGT